MRRNLYLLISMIVIITLGILIIFKSTPSKAENISVGFIDSQKVLENHPRAKEVNDKIMDFKTKELKAFQDKKQEDLDKELKEKFGDKTLENLPQKDQAEAYKIFSDRNVQFKEEAEIKLINKQNELLSPLLKDIESAIKDVGVKKNLTVVLEKNVVYYGGVDITDEVISQLKKAK